MPNFREANEDDDASQCAPSTAVDDIISPIACAFGNELLLGSIMDLSDLAASYGRSAAEAAWRGDVSTLAVHLREARNAIAAAEMAFGALENEKAADAELAPA